MRNRRKLFLRTETFEQILIRSKNTESISRAGFSGTVTAQNGIEKYRIEIYRIEADSDRKVFQCDLPGFAGIVEDEFQNSSTDQKDAVFFDAGERKS